MKIIPDATPEEIKGMEMGQSELMGCIIIKAFIATASLMFTPHMHSMLVDDLKEICTRMMKDVHLNSAEKEMVTQLLLEETNGKGSNAKRLAFELIKNLK